jgi:predicted esterase
MNVFHRGPDPSQARLSLILVHGRGASADGMLSLADELGLDDIAFLALQAPGGTWYPHSFLAPIADNEPGISAGLEALDSLRRHLGEQQVGSPQIGILGFSQGACLALEYAARHARRYAAILGLSGGLIGPPGTPRNYPGSLAGTPVLFGCSDVDPHIPLERVHESVDVFRKLGATVDERIYKGMGHTISRDEIDAAKTLLSARPEAKEA